MNARSTTHTSSISRDVVLPSKIKTKCGVEIDPRCDEWKIKDALRSVSFSFLSLKISDQMLTQIKFLLIWHAENMSSATLQTIFYSLKHFFFVLNEKSETVFDEITSSEILLFKSTLTRRTEQRLGSLSSVLRRWYELGIGGITKDAALLLESMRLRGPIRGEAVRTSDPFHGHFNDLEFEELQTTLFSSYETGHIDIEQFTLAMLVLCFGQRPVQYAALKVCDFTSTAVVDGMPTYVLQMPRAKRKFGMPRERFTERVLYTKLGILVEQCVNSVKSRLIGKLIDVNQAPLFPTPELEINSLPGFEYHMSAVDLSVKLKKIFESLNVISVRTGTVLNITAYRFRYTTGTRAAMEGHGELVIAELLDHSDTQNVGVYVSAVPEIVARIDKAMALSLIPIAQAFSGNIIEDESKSKRFGDTSSRICDPKIDETMKPMGSCGSFGFCGALAPVACYTCRNFEPWVDGPHEAMLEYLISERQRLVETTDLRIASINDRTIFAVAAVVKRCAKFASGAP